MDNARIFSHEGVQYLAAWNPQRVEVFGNVVFDCLQSVRNIFSEVQLVLPTPTGDLIVVAAKEVVYYSLITTKRRDRLWQKCASEPIEYHVLSGQFCCNAGVLVLLSSHHIMGMGIVVKQEETVTAQITLNWVVRVKQPLFEMTISTDERYIALRAEENKVLIWDLEKLPELILKTVTLEQFVESNQVVGCDEPILKVEFRRQEQANQPNSVYLLTGRFLQLYQEVRLDDMPSSFVLLLEVPLNDAKALLQMERLPPVFRESEQEVVLDSRRQSVDAVCIHCATDFCVYELYGLRSAKVSAGHKLLKRLNLPGIDQLLQIVFKPGDKHLSMVGRRQANLCRLLYMYFEDQILQCKYFCWVQPLNGIIADETSSKIALRGPEGALFVVPRHDNWLKAHDVLQEEPRQLKPNVQEKVVLFNNFLYWVVGSKLCALNVQNGVLQEIPFHKPTLRELYALCSHERSVYLLCDGEVIRVSAGTATSIKTLLPFNRVLKMEYNAANNTLLIKNPKWYTLYRLKIQPHEQLFELIEIRKSSRHLIYGGGYWAELYESEVVFGAGSNKLVSFSIGQFLGAISRQHDVKVLFYRIYHVCDDVFQLQIQNYVFFLYVEFDTHKQKHTVTAVRRNKHTVELLMARANRLTKPEALEVVLVDRDLTIRTQDHVVFVGRYMGEMTTSPQGLTSSTQLNFSMIRNPVPMHHPKFLNELLQLGNFAQVETILLVLHSQIVRQGRVDEEFRLELADFLRILNTDKYPELEIASRYSEVVDSKQDRTALLKELSALILEDSGRTGLRKNNPLLLSSVVDFCVFRQENARSLDYFSSIFISQTRHLWMSKSQCLSTKELCWILHSNNKEEAFELLIEQPLRQKEEQLSWPLLTKYAAVLWYDNVQHIRKWLERIALAEYRRAQDPFDCLLWYVLLGKKNIVVALFKKAADQVKTYEFLQRDFTQQQHRTAASKNAYALLSKKRYEHAIAFFVLAAGFSDALSICLNQLKDVQLAILICKMFEAEMSRQPLQNLYRQNFLRTGQITGDIWIRHCGYYLLGEHVASYNCLYEETYDDTKVSNEASKVSCETWRPQFQPELSVFHPSVMILADLIKDSFKIKRELQEHEESRRRGSNSQDIFESADNAPVEEQPLVPEKFLQPNEALHLRKSANYYLMINIPYMALTLMLQHREFLQEEPMLFQTICEKYVDQLFASSVTYVRLDSSLSRIADLNKLTEGLATTNFYEYFARKLLLVDCGELMLPWYLKLGEMTKAEAYLEKYVGQVKQLLMEECTPFKVQTRGWYLSTMHFIYWLQQNLKLLRPQLLSAEPRMNRLFGQLFVCLQLCKVLLLLRIDSTKGLNQSLKELVIACERMNKNESLEFNDDSHQLSKEDFEELQTLIPERKHQLQTSKTSKRMDILEESFRRTIEEEKEQPSTIDEEYLTKLVFQFVTLGSLVQRSTIEPWVREILLKSKEHVRCKIDALMPRAKFEEILTELRDLLKNGAFFWGKTKYLALNQSTDRQDLVDRMVLVESERFISNKLQSSLGKQLRDGRRTNKEVLEAKDVIFRNGIQLFKNRTETARFFAVNIAESPQYGEAVILFKKSIKKVDMHAAIATRNRSQDGSTLLDEDVVYTVPVDPSQKAEVRSAVLAQCLSLLSSEVDRKVELVQSSRKIDFHASQYLRQQDQRAYTDFNELNSVVSHRHLPLFMIGAKASIDVLAFSSMKSLARLQCPGMSELVRLRMDSMGDFIGACDSDGGFSSYRFDAGYGAAPSLLLRKTNVSEFSYLNSNLVATASNKDSLLQVYDPLIAPARNCVYKDRVSNAIAVEYITEGRKLLVVKKNQVNIFDVRRGFLNRFDTTSMTAGDNRCCGLTTTSHHVILGGTQGELRIFNLDGEELLGLKPFRTSKKSSPVQEVRVARSNIFALSGDGALSFCYSMD